MASALSETLLAINHKSMSSVSLQAMLYYDLQEETINDFGKTYNYGLREERAILHRVCI